MFGFELLRRAREAYRRMVAPHRVEVEYEHDGMVDWRCRECRQEGRKPFVGLKTKTEVPAVVDYDVLVTEAEIEHAITGCRGRLMYVCGIRHKVVKHERVY